MKSNFGFALTGFYNPLGTMPGPMIPVFKPNQPLSEGMYRAISDERTIIDCFEIIDRSAKLDQLNFFLLDPHVREIRWVGDALDCAFLFPDGQFQYFRTARQLWELVDAEIRSDMFIDFPFLGLSLAGQANAPSEEQDFAKRCVRKLFNSSPRVASSWVRAGVMSDPAREVAAQVFNELMKGLAHKPEPKPEKRKRDHNLWISKSLQSMLAEVSHSASEMAEASYGIFDPKNGELPHSPLGFILLRSLDIAEIESNPRVAHGLTYLVRTGVSVIVLDLTGNRSIEEIRGDRKFISKYLRQPIQSFDFPNFVQKIERRILK